MKSNDSLHKPPLNPWSFVAIVCSVGMCPFFTIAGVLLGVRALVDINTRPGTRGVRLAWAAICIGSLVTGLWGGGMLWWNTPVRSQMQPGPVTVIIQGQAGDVTGFESIFVASPIEGQAAHFIDQMTRRYGMLSQGGPSERAGVEAVDGEELVFFLVPLKAQIPYTLQFFGGSTVEATAQFLLFHDVDGRRQFTNKFTSIHIIDEELGDLLYPLLTEEPVTDKSLTQ